MKRIAIQFQIQSLESKQEFSVIGELKNKRIKFIDPENNTNYIVFHGDIIEYHKKGNVDMKYKFMTNMKTKGYYNVDSIKFDFDILTSSILVEDKKLVIKYQLYDQDELINDTQIKIEYSTVEEE